MVGFSGVLGVEGVVGVVGVSGVVGLVGLLGLVGVVGPPEPEPVILMSAQLLKTCTHIDQNMQTHRAESSTG